MSRVVLRFPNAMMDIWGADQVQFVFSKTSGPVALPNTADSCLASFNLCHLLYKMFSAGATVSSFGRPVFKFALQHDTLSLEISERGRHELSQLYKSLSCQTF